MNFDVEDLTLGEIETLEELCNASFDELFADNKPKGKAMRAIVFIVNRRTNPDYTYEETANIKISDFDVDAVKK